jgi:hypothetical protein
MENSHTSDDSPDASPSHKRSSRKRLLALVVAGGTQVTVALAYIQLWLVRPTGVGPAGPSASKEAFHEPWTERPVVE